MKRFLSVFLAALMVSSLSVTAFADELEYNEYDNYDEFEQDYYNTVVFPENNTQNLWYKDISIIPVVIGIAAGGITVFVLLRRQSALDRCAPAPHRYTVKINHTINNSPER